MPEIAEVETVRKTLKKQIIKRKIIDVKVLYPKMVNISETEFKEKLINNIFNDIKRRGKWLIFDLNEYSLLSHLRMEGKYFIKKTSEPILKHEHIIFSLDNNYDLRYHDTRKFGRMILIKTSNLSTLNELSKQGIEANSNDLTGVYLKEKLEKKTQAIKTVLLDQTIISGLGNIYVNEVLFAAKINPLKKANLLKLKELEQITKHSKRIIDRAIELGGTTIKSYTSSLGITGRFQQELMVQNREGEPCYICNTNIVKIKVNGRGTYFCPSCQK